MCARVICLQYTKKSDLHAGTLVLCMFVGVVCKYSTFRAHGCACSCVAFWPSFLWAEDGLWKFSVVTHHSSRCLSHPTHFCFCLWQILLNCFIFYLNIFFLLSAEKIVSASSLIVQRSWLACVPVLLYAHTFTSVFDIREVEGGAKMHTPGQD